MATGRVPTTANSPLTAKGDLFGYSTTQARVPVGNDGETLVADSSTSTGLRYANNYGFAAGKNKILNSDYSIWQRGTSSLTFTNGVSYTADRWAGVVSGGAPTCTVTRQTADTTGLTYGARFGRNSGQTATGTPYFCQALESIASKPLAGQTVTISFYAKKGADAPSTLYAGFYFGTGTDQSINTLFNGGGWTNTTQSNTGFTVTTTMTRYSVTINVASTINQALLYFAYTSSGTAGANEWYQIEGVQVEIGPVATAFQTATGTLAGELAACQRYYYRIADSSNNYTCITAMTNVCAQTTTNLIVSIQNPVPMRAASTTVEFASLGYQISGGTVFAISAVAVDTGTDSIYGSLANLTVATTTAGSVGRILVNNSNSGYFALSAEL